MNSHPYIALRSPRCTHLCIVTVDNRPQLEGVDLDVAQRPAVAARGRGSTYVTGRFVHKSRS